MVNFESAYLVKRRRKSVREFSANDSLTGDEKSNLDFTTTELSTFIFYTTQDVENNTNILSGAVRRSSEVLKNRSDRL
jgi:hypothetical protein